MELSLDEDRIRAIVARLASLRANYGDAFENPDLVEPNGEYFPDEFSLSAEGVETLLQRVLAYTPLSDELDIQLGFIQPDGEVQGGGCGSGACGTGGMKEIARGGALETENGYAALVHVSDVGDPTILTTALSRAAGRIIMFEADEQIDPRDEGALAELTAVASGLGLLLFNGACVYKKGCSGMKRHQATFNSLEELAFALALWVRTNDKKPGAVRKHLEVTQREIFDSALDWVDGQPTLVRTLTEHPDRLEDGVFSFEEKKGLFSRLFASKKRDEDIPLNVKRTERSPEELRRLAEARALVDEALSD